jgi:hypothetical protein
VRLGFIKMSFRKDVSNNESKVYSEKSIWFYDGLNGDVGCWGSIIEI